MGEFREAETLPNPVSVSIETGAVDTPVWVSISRNVPDTLISEADKDLAARGRHRVSGTLLRIDAEDIHENTIASFKKEIRLRIPSAKDDNLLIAYLDNGRWVELEGTSYDEDSGVAEVLTKHLSVWGVTAGFPVGPGVEASRVYPNPWRSNGPTASLSPSNDAYGIKFDRLPAGNVRFRIYTLAGELVLDGTLNPATVGATAEGGHLKVVDLGGGTGQVTRWDLKNRNGRDVSSGTYLIVLEGKGGRAVHKVAIIH
ncbi:MAG: hypothetical protein D6679_02860 [Candidatus Hydrogenedentota bacterium]|nr:MAG: hypothetical protein D6679_02860 [Candidatus Hydrogenedentota bacterium]